MFAAIKFINMKKNYSQIIMQENSASSYAGFFKSSILKCSKTMLAFLFTLFFAGNLLAQSADFVTTWDLSKSGSSNATSLTIGTATSGSVSYSWKELPSGTPVNGTFSGTSLNITGLPSGKTIELRISPTNFQRIHIANTGDKMRLTEVKQWGTTAWTSFQNAFFGCENLNITATDIPNLAGVQRMDQMFQTCKNLSTVPNINSWNTSNIENMASLFNNCNKFNENISGWNTSKVISMSQMFRSAWIFNQNIGNWNTSKVTTMWYMFNLAGAFNQDISGWNTGSVTNMSSLFEWASAFNQNLGNWSLNSSVTLDKMLDKSGLSCANYEATLIGWNSQSVNGRTLGASGLNYGGNATAARANLVKSTLNSGKGWTISGDNSSNVCDAFITTWDLSKGGNATELKIGTTTSGNVSYTWAVIPSGTSGSGTFTTTGNQTQTISGLPSGKKIRLTISPTHFQRIRMSNGSGGTTPARLTEVNQWGTTAWTSFQDAFFGCENLNITATGIPNLAGVQRMDQMFQTCKNLSTVPNINSWNTSNIENMASLFNNCNKFNENISGWNTSKVISMSQMFRSAWIFNQNIGNWNTSKVTTMWYMFNLAGAFNQNISGWNTGSVTNMTGMFELASAFNQNLGNWSLNSSVTLDKMLDKSGLSCANYSATLIGWSSQSVTGRTLGASGRTYGSYASSARTNLDVTKNWTITDGGVGTCSAPAPSVQMIDFGGFIKHDVSNLDKPLNVYPNPATDFINLEFKGIAPSTFNVLVMDMSGKVIIKLDGVHAESNLYTLPLNGIVSGMYVVKLSDELGNTTINRFNIK
jgi:surface protein